MNKIRRLVATLGLAVALVMSSAGLASAQRWSHTDASRDIVTFAGGEDDPVLAVAPDRDEGDVVSTTISHTRTKVVIRLRMRTVPRGDWVATAQVRTPRSTYYLHQVKFDDERHFTIFADSDGPRCTAKSSRIDRTALVLTVARSCLGNPRWIRVGAAIITFEQNPTDDEEVDGVSYVDDSLRRTLGGDLRFSPRLRRG